MSHGEPWPEAQDAVIRENWRLVDGLLTPLVNAAGPERSIRAVEQRRHALGLLRSVSTPHDDATKAWIKTEYIDKGRSASEVADELGLSSRSAVIGLATRCGWTRRTTVGRQNSLAARKTRSAGKPPPPTPAARAFHHGAGVHSVPAPSAGHTNPSANNPRLAVAVPNAKPRHLPMTHPDFGGCLWPTREENGRWLFCCAKRPDGATYCGPHAKVAFQPESGNRTKRGPPAVKDRDVEHVKPTTEEEPAPVDLVVAA